MDRAATLPDQPDRVDELLDAVLARPRDARSEALAQACREHPDHAATLRRRYDALAGMDLLPDDDEDAAAPLPRAFGDFTLIDRIGGGGMGVVYRARQTSLDREVALKLLRPELTYFEQTRARLQREANAIARLDHPGILPIHAVGEVHGVPYLVMPLLDGWSLAELLQQLRGRDPATVAAADLELVPGRPEAADGTAPARCQGDWTRTAVRLVLKIGEALAHAHARGIVHRDVKPSNVMLTRDGRVLLLDFGLASTEHAPGITRPGTFMGSIAYASPEQLQVERVDARTDVFALGVVLYELLALQSPFLADSVTATVQRVLTLDPPALQSRNPRVGPDLAAIVRKAIEKSARVRYPDMPALCADLRAFLAGGAISVLPDTRWRRARRWVRRQPVLAAAFGLLATTLLFAVGWVGYALAIRGTVAIGRAKQRADAAEAEVLRGFVELAHGGAAGARARFDRALAIDPGCAAAATGIWLLQPPADAGAAVADDAPAEVLFRRAAWLLVNGPRDDGTAAREASALMSRAVLRTPVARPLYHYKWLEAAGQAHDAAGVQAATDAASCLWPESPFTHFWIGTAWMEQDRGRAAAELRQALVLDPGFDRARAQLGTVLLEQGDAAGGAALLEQTVALEPANTRAWIDLSIARDRIGDHAGAVAAARRAVGAADTLAGAHYNLGRLLASGGDRPGAIAAYQRTLELEPRYWQARQNLGLLLADGGDHGAAIGQFRQLVALRPNDAEAHRCMAFACFLAGDHGGAIAAYREIVRLLPDDRDARDWLDRLRDHGDEAGGRRVEPPEPRARGRGGCQ